jgi:hypothetical protein
VLTLAAGLILGWGLALGLAGSRTPELRASGGDRWDESILASGPTFVRYNEGSKVQVAQDAVYFLDYRAGRLLGTIPMMRQTVGPSKMLDGFAERDLVADFHLDTETGPRPHFLMTTSSMSTGSASPYGDGWAPLFVVETTTRQVAVYKIQQQTIGAATQTRLELVEVHPFGRPAAR